MAGIKLKKTKKITTPYQSRQAKRNMSQLMRNEEGVIDRHWNNVGSSGQPRYIEESLKKKKKWKESIKKVPNASLKIKSRKK